MRQNTTTFPHISNEIIKEGIHKGRVERSKALYALIDGIFGRQNSHRDLSDG